MTNEELILLKSEMDNLKNTVSEMKKEIKDHNGFSTQIALLNQTVTELSKVVKELKEEVVGKPAKRWETIITSFTILICFFYYMYFTSDYSEEIRAKNTTEHTENYNYTEHKENIERKVNENVGMD